jgi:hypothetical protein
MTSAQLFALMAPLMVLFFMGMVAFVGRGTERRYQMRETDNVPAERRTARIWMITLALSSVACVFIATMLLLVRHFADSAPVGGFDPYLLRPEVDFARAVPEPSTWAMLILGFLGLGFATYRRTKRDASTTMAAEKR